MHFASSVMILLFAIHSFSEVSQSSNEPYRIWVDEVLFSEGEIQLLRQLIDSSSGKLALAVSNGTRMSFKGYYTPEKWDLYWTTIDPCVKAYRVMRSSQKVNCLLGGHAIADKKALVSTMQAAYGELAFQIMPRSYLLPEQYWTWRSWSLRAKEPASAIWVLKQNRHRGKGVHVVTGAQAQQKALTRLRDDETGEEPMAASILQQGILPQKVIQGRRFYLRVWTLITDTDPLRLYLFQGGLAIFGGAKDTDQTSGKDSSGRNNSNRTGTGGPSSDIIVNLFKMNRTEAMSWTLQQLREYLREETGSEAAFHKMWAGVERKLALTMAAGTPTFRRLASSHHVAAGAFEAFGVDFILDPNLEPWLLEVNRLPSMARQTSPDTCPNSSAPCGAETAGMNPFDLEKLRFLHSLLHILGLPVKRVEAAHGLPPLKGVNHLKELFDMLHAAANINPALNASHPTASHTGSSASSSLPSPVAMLDVNATFQKLISPFHRIVKQLRKEDRHYVLKQARRLALAHALSEPGVDRVGGDGRGADGCGADGHGVVGHGVEGKAPDKGLVGTNRRSMDKSEDRAPDRGGKASEMRGREGGEKEGRKLHEGRRGDDHEREHAADLEGSMVLGEDREAGVKQALERATAAAVAADDHTEDEEDEDGNSSNADGFGSSNASHNIDQDDDDDDDGVKGVGFQASTSHGQDRSLKVATNKKCLLLKDLQLLAGVEFELLHSADFIPLFHLNHAQRLNQQALGEKYEEKQALGETNVEEQALRVSEKEEQAAGDSDPGKYEGQDVSGLTNGSHRDWPGVWEKLCLAAGLVSHPRSWRHFTMQAEVAATVQLPHSRGDIVLEAWWGLRRERRCAGVRGCLRLLAAKSLANL